MKKGFTLAEVLITLGIIGVVAAITLPTLIKNYQKHVWVNQLKKSVSTIENGFHKMMADEEVFSLTDTEVFKTLYPNACDFCGAPDSAECKNFYNELKKYFKITSIQKVNNYDMKNLDGSFFYSNYDWYAIIFQDGSMLVIYEFPDYTSHEDSGMGIGRIYLDVNGLKAPNTLGRDIYQLTFSPKGQLQNYYPEEGCIDRNGDSVECAERIIKNGWKMDY